MTPQHRLAVEIMSECGKTPHEIASHGFANSVNEPTFRYTAKEIELVLGMDSDGMKKRNNRFITHNGKTRMLSDWARITGLRQDVISKRLGKGWPVGEALTKPLRVTSRTRRTA